MREIKFILLILIMAAVIIIGFSKPLKSKVTGPCSNCHTMHYSQNGAQLEEWDPNGPNEYLLTQDCLGCHSASDGSTWKDPVTGAPIVYNHSEPTYGARYENGPYQGLSAGNFYWVEHVNDNRGHNAFDGNPDDILDHAPGTTGAFDTCGTNNCHVNLDKAFDDSPIPNYLEGRYGCKGCHMVSGSNQFNEIKTWHHADDSDTVVDSADEGWFRFLSGHISGDGHGVSGIEDDDWQYSTDANNHNEYLGAQEPTGPGGFVNIDADTMTAFCTGCHGKFHKKQRNGLWIRHPIDEKIPISQGYEEYTTYDPLVPVARPDLTGWTGPKSVVNEGGEVKKDMVMCISCHRAHGSPYPDSLRWDYDSIMTGTGCVTCHTTKKGTGS